MTAAFVYKIVSAADWARAKATGIVAPSPVDVRDGYIHLSDPGQTLETADRHFADAADLVALEIPAERIAAALRYEPAPKRGALFPHLYGPLRSADVARVRPLRRVDGAFQFVDS
ncbi:MAG: DUF952 domain-containing protein [Parvularculaceae bacterium]|nr:DUF952 domain-containing protein [Parvularculaceae bacterium]